MPHAAAARLLQPLPLPPQLLRRPYDRRTHSHSVDNVLMALQRPTAAAATRSRHDPLRLTVPSATSRYARPFGSCDNLRQQRAAEAAAMRRTWTMLQVNGDDELLLRRELLLLSDDAGDRTDDEDEEEDEEEVDNDRDDVQMEMEQDEQELDEDDYDDVEYSSTASSLSSTTEFAHHYHHQHLPVVGAALRPRRRPSGGGGGGPRRSSLQRSASVQPLLLATVGPLRAKRKSTAGGPPKVRHRSLQQQPLHVQQQHQQQHLHLQQHQLQMQHQLPLHQSQLQGHHHLWQPGHYRTLPGTRCTSPQSVCGGGGGGGSGAFPVWQLALEDGAAGGGHQHQHSEAGSSVRHCDGAGGGGEGREGGRLLRIVPVCTAVSYRAYHHSVASVPSSLSCGLPIACGGAGFGFGSASRARCHSEGGTRERNSPQNRSRDSKQLFLNWKIMVRFNVIDRLYFKVIDRGLNARLTVDRIRFYLFILSQQKFGLQFERKWRDSLLLTGLASKISIED